MQYIDIVNRVVVNQRDLRWVDRELSQLRFETEQFRPVLQRVCTQHCTSGLYTLTFHFLGSLLEYLERSGSLAVTDAVSFQHFNVEAR